MSWQDYTWIFVIQDQVMAVLRARIKIYYWKSPFFAEWCWKPAYIYCEGAVVSTNCKWLATDCIHVRRGRRSGNGYIWRFLTWCWGNEPFVFNAAISMYLSLRYRHRVQLTIWYHVMLNLGNCFENWTVIYGSPEPPCVEIYFCFSFFSRSPEPPRRKKWVLDEKSKILLFLWEPWDRVLKDA